MKLFKTTILFAALTFSIQNLASEIDLQENWQLLDRHAFGFLQTLERTQGLTTDNKGHFWFSSNWGLISTSSPFGSSIISNTQAIPVELKRHGANHIGDIDFGLDRIYAPIEDGSTYRAPFVGVYDPRNLQLIEFFSLSKEDQPDGVPWLAVDVERHQAYSSIYGDCKAIIVYDLATFKKLGQIPLSETLHSVQGAKVEKGRMYLTANADKTVYNVDLSNGKVSKMFKLPEDIYEIEGLALVRQEAGLRLAILAIVKPGGALSRRSQLLIYGP